jgi:two-component system, NtrC family, nitrogen regulation sensor histidine kinase NtrY
VSLEGKLAALLLASLLLGAALTAGLAHVLGAPVLAAGIAVALGLVTVTWVARRAVRPVRHLLRALEGAVASYRDGDFSLSLSVRSRDELGQLAAAHNELGRALREQRSHLAQREALLDTVTQNSPMGLVLVDAHLRVAYANIAARHLLNEGKSFTGQDFGALLARAPEALCTAVQSGADSLFTTEIGGVEETFHLSQRAFQLQGRPYRLYLLKTLTRELSRQEVAIWKKLIRVLSHEINNSLGPLTSVAQSGAELARRGDAEGVSTAFAVIGERSAHLLQFISGYAAFARLPAPRPESIEWRDFARLVPPGRCRAVTPWPAAPGWFDRAQLTQALINLLDNAHEAGGPAEQIELAVAHVGGEQRIEVRDRGPGMSEPVLQQALLPFYSTKRRGTGLGLALAREIAEAHGGRIHLANREGGGLSVTLILPLPARPAAGDASRGMSRRPPFLP